MYQNGNHAKLAWYKDHPPRPPHSAAQFPERTLPPTFEAGKTDVIVRGAA